jgi:hypothetical protein
VSLTPSWELADSNYIQIEEQIIQIRQKILLFERITLAIAAKTPKWLAIPAMLPCFDTRLMTHNWMCVPFSGTLRFWISSAGGKALKSLIHIPMKRAKHLFSRALMSVLSFSLIVSTAALADDETGINAKIQSYLSQMTIQQKLDYWKLN